jgi:D-beta-D-heptose 7-phosphate kinase / D-beta-D-heptose 1-phosphate adenosyltransferase
MIETHEIIQEMPMFREKCLDPENFVSVAKTLKGEGGTLVLAFGCFDLLHLGSVRFLRDAALLGDRLLVGVYCDDWVRRFRGSGRPIVPLSHRLTLVAAIEGVFAVFPFNPDNAQSFIKMLNPDFVLLGENMPELTPPSSKCRIIANTRPAETCSEWLVESIRTKLSGE